MVKNRKLLAEQLVEESVVLLKNENQLLPLQEGQTVAVFGRSALVTYVSGNGSGAARGAESSNIIIELEMCIRDSSCMNRLICEGVTGHSKIGPRMIT